MHTWAVSNFKDSLYYAREEIRAGSETMYECTPIEDHMKLFMNQLFFINSLTMQEDILHHSIGQQNKGV